jgi:hypothetical protein
MANELIEQILKSNLSSCNCVENIPEKSLIEYRNEQTPLAASNDRIHIRKELNLISEKSLDSLEMQSNNIILDRKFLEKNHLKFVREQTHPYEDSDCPCAVALITKPIFDKDFKTAVIYFDYDRSDCFSGHILTYKYLNGKWLAK